MAEEATEQTASNSGGKGLIIILIVLVVVLILAVAGGGYFLYSQGMFSPKEQTQEMMKKENPEQEETFKTEINDLVLNITSSKGKEKLMKLSFAIKSVEPTITTLIEQNKAEIIDIVISAISSKDRSSEDLLTIGGKNLLREELIQEMNEVLNKAAQADEDIKQNSIKQILFTTFVIK